MQGTCHNQYKMEQISDWKKQSAYKNLTRWRISAWNRWRHPWFHPHVPRQVLQRSLIHRESNYTLIQATKKIPFLWFNWYKHYNNHLIPGCFIILSLFTLANFKLVIDSLPKREDVDLQGSTPMWMCGLVSHQHQLKNIPVQGDRKGTCYPGLISCMILIWQYNHLHVMVCIVYTLILRCVYPTEILLLSLFFQFSHIWALTCRIANISLIKL